MPTQLPAALLAALICPRCAGYLDGGEQLTCPSCLVTYPIVDGVPDMVFDHATPLPFDTDIDFENLVAEAVAAPFAGWDWSWLVSRRQAEHWPLDLAPLYADRARELVGAATTGVLDLGTGGGERLAHFGPFPSISTATESYPPNAPLAAQRLALFGVSVIQVDAATHNSRGPEARNRWPERRLPFADSTFDVVLAHNSAFSPREVARVLRPGGTLLTRQNQTEWRGETLADALGASPPEWTVPGQGWPVGHTLFEAGFEIVQWRDAQTRITFRDIGGVVYSLLHVPWIVPGFDLARYRPRLYRLHQRMQREGGFRTTSHAFLTEARKP